MESYNSKDALLQAPGYQYKLVYFLSHMICVGSKDVRLRQLVSSGEPLSLSLLSKLQEALPSCRILNLYGCTEASGDSLCYEAPSDTLISGRDARY